jgi:hypothetical protein
MEQPAMTMTIAPKRITAKEVTASDMTLLFALQRTIATTLESAIILLKVAPNLSRQMEPIAVTAMLALSMTSASLENALLHRM